METTPPLLELQLGKRLYVRHVRNLVNQELRTNGIKSVADQLSHQGYVLGQKDLGSWSNEKIAAAWEAAKDNGLTDETIVNYSARPEVGALGDGSILDFIGNLFQWIYDHRDKIMMVVRFIISLLAMFGI